jgi:hypothetical protein
MKKDALLLRYFGFHDLEEQMLKNWMLMRTACMGRLGVTSQKP